MFNPDPGCRLLLPQLEYPLGASEPGGGILYEVEASPAVPCFAYQSEGAKAVIFRLQRADDNSRWALKVFKAAFRSHTIRDACARLADLSRLPGLQAARRAVLAPDHAAVCDYPELAWAVLMPWVSGRTWYDIIALAHQNRSTLDWAQSVAIAEGFTRVMAELERREIAHTDISSGNVTMTLPGYTKPWLQSRDKDFGVELIDLEDLWRSGAVISAHYTPGYGHPSLKRGATTACPEGDRYSTAILIAELLALSDPDLAAQATPDGYFRGDKDDPAACARYEAVQRRLKLYAPAFSDALAQVWRSQTLAECPPIAALAVTLGERNLDLQPLLSPIAPSRPAWARQLRSHDSHAPGGPPSPANPSGTTCPPWTRGRRGYPSAPQSTGWQLAQASATTPTDAVKKADPPEEDAPGRERLWRDVRIVMSMALLAAVLIWSDPKGYAGVLILTLIFTLLALRSDRCWPQDGKGTGTAAGRQRPTSAPPRRNKVGR